MNPRRAKLLILQALFGVILLTLWVRAVDFAAVGAILSQANWPLLLLAAGLGLASGAIRVRRWKMLLRPIARVTCPDMYLSGIRARLVNLLIPSRTSEVSKSLLLKHRHRAPLAAWLPTVAIDRAFDLMPVLALGAAGAVLGVRLDRRLSLIIVSGGVLFVGFVGPLGLGV